MGRPLQTWGSLPIQHNAPCDAIYAPPCSYGPSSHGRQPCVDTHLLEVVAEAPGAKHLEEGMVVRVLAHLPYRATPCSASP